MPLSKPDITLYTAQTPNGIKISILLEELRIPYEVTTIALMKSQQKESWYLEINPNGRIPAIEDRSFNSGGGIKLFESGAILQYLVEVYDRDHSLSYPHGSLEYWETQKWLFFQNAGVGPMQGQANHFLRYAPEKIPYAIKRYTDETKRLFSILDKQLEKSKSGFLVGDRLTIADIANYGWVNSSGYSGIDIDEFPHLKAWVTRLGTREGFVKGRDVPEPSHVK